MYGFIYYRVKDVMTPKPFMVNKDVTLSEAEDIFEKHDFNGIPVVDKRDQLIGMMTKLDFLKAFAFTERSKMPHYDAIMGQTISNMLTRDPRVVSPEPPPYKGCPIYDRNGIQEPPRHRLRAGCRDRCKRRYHKGSAAGCTGRGFGTGRAGIANIGLRRPFWDWPFRDCIAVLSV